VKRGVLICVLVLVAAVPAVAATTSSSVNVLKVFRTQIAAIKKHSKVPVILPATLPFAGKVPKVYTAGGGTAKSWSLELDGAPRCGGADACFLASFEALRGGKLPGKPNLELAGGQAAFYKGVTCGASCSPASLWFVYKGVLYSWQHKDAPRNTKSVLARLATQAIAAGPR
jgi:hypothetical protein